MTANPPLLLLDAVRIDRDGSPGCNGLEAVSRAERLALVGDWSALFALLGGQTRLLRGRAEIAGVPAERAVAAGQVGLVPREWPLPGRMSTLDYLAASLRLAGMWTRCAAERARAALARFGLESLGRRRIDQLSPLERRGVGFAHALLGEIAVVALETPLAGLHGEAVGVVMSWVGQLASTHRLIISLQNGLEDPVERNLLDRVQDVLVLTSPGVTVQGPPSEVLRVPTRYAVLLRSHWDELIELLRARGLEASVNTLAPRGLVELSVELPTPEALDSLRDAIVTSGAPVIELLPVALSHERGL